MYQEQASLLMVQGVDLATGQQGVTHLFIYFLYFSICVIKAENFNSALGDIT